MKGRPSPSLSLPLSAPQSLRAARLWAAAWAVLLLALTSWPGPPQVPILSGIPDFDKLVHGVLYAVEAFLLYRSVKWPGRPRFAFSRVLVILGVMAVWGVADETHQTWIPGRSVEGGDVAADVTGAAAGALAASLASRPRPRAVSL